MRAPDPGTGQAVGLGCTCPVTENHYGEGYRGGNGLRWDEGGRYVVLTDCPIHGRIQDKEDAPCPVPPFSISRKPAHLNES